MPTKAELEAQLAEKEQQLAETEKKLAEAEANPAPAAAPATQELVPVAYVVPTYTDAIVFPTNVQIPLAVAQTAGCLRHFAIERADEPIPKPVYEWLLNDGRYNPWFKAGVDPKVVEQPSE